MTALDDLPDWTGERVRTMAFDRVAIVGDIHGSADRLERLLHALDRPLLVAGDLCDRGPDTRGVLDLLVDAGASGVLGNHDLWFARWSMGHGLDPFALSAAMGGHATLASYGAGPEDWQIVPRAHAAFVNGLHLVIDLEVAGVPYWLCHAGLPPGLPSPVPPDILVRLAHQAPEALLWTKQDPTAMPDTGRTLVHGHVRLPRVFDNGHTLSLDTGSPHRELTAVLLPERVTLSA